jgi:MoaA/NifB/PqqE/SkfB family radical SAM enzyme
MTEIIKVTPTDVAIKLTWMIGARCNYDCMYCSTELHDKTSQHHSLEYMQNAWMSFYEKTKDLDLPYKIAFTGGEVTANKNFLPLVRWMREQPVELKILLSSNGSASLPYYLKLCKLVDALSLSVHSEFINEKVFFEKAKELNKVMIRPEKSFHINIMDEFWNQDRIPIYKKFLEEHDISHSVNRINYTVQTRTFPIFSKKAKHDQV